MKSYIVLLRGINVGGHKKILMAELRKLLGELPFSNIETYIQSGNIVLDSDEEPSEIKGLIQRKIKDFHGYDVPTIVIEAQEFIKVLNKNPFIEENSNLYFSFLSEGLNNEQQEVLDRFSFDLEEVQLIGKVFYLNLHEAYAKATINNNFFEKKLKVSATTRNWKTTQKLTQIAKERILF